MYGHGDGCNSLRVDQGWRPHQVKKFSKIMKKLITQVTRAWFTVLDEDPSPDSGLLKPFPGYSQLGWFGLGLAALPVQFTNFSPPLIRTTSGWQKWIPYIYMALFIKKEKEPSRAACVRFLLVFPGELNLRYSLNCSYVCSHVTIQSQKQSSLPCLCAILKGI